MYLSQPNKYLINWAYTTSTLLLNAVVGTHIKVPYHSTGAFETIRDLNMSVYANCQRYQYILLFTDCQISIYHFILTVKYQYLTVYWLSDINISLFTDFQIYQYLTVYWLSDINISLFTDFQIYQYITVYWLSDINFSHTLPL